MTMEMVIHTLALCIVLAGAETLHGIARTVFLAPRLGRSRAIRLSIISGTTMAFGICYVLVPGIGLSTVFAHFMLGIVLAFFMASFDLVIGVLLMKRSLAMTLNDFNPTTGNLLLFGLAALIFIPTVVAYIRGLI